MATAAFPSEQRFLLTGVDWRTYQRELEDTPVERNLDQRRQSDGPLHDPEHTQPWTRRHSLSLVFVVCLVAFVVGELVALAVGGGP